MLHLLKLPLAFLFLCAFVLSYGVLSCGEVQAHTIFKKALEKKYNKELRVTCNMCHVKGEPKTARNEFGELFYEELKELDLTAQWQDLKGDDRKAFEKDVMTPEFLKALEVILEKETEEGEKYSDLIPNGKIPGSKLKKKKESDNDKDSEKSPRKTPHAARKDILREGESLNV